MTQLVVLDICSLTCANITLNNYYLNHLYMIKKEDYSLENSLIKNIIP